MLNIEILSETVHYFDYYSSIIVLGILALFCLVTAAKCHLDSVYREETYKITNRTMSIILLVATFVFLGLILAKHPYVTYKAAITDFNEVYNQGYKIVDQDGKIFTLEKR